MKPFSNSLQSFIESKGKSATQNSHNANPITPQFEITNELKRVLESITEFDRIYLVCHTFKFL